MSEQKLGAFPYAGSIDAMVAGRQYDMPLMAGGSFVTLAQIAEIAQGLEKDKFHPAFRPAMNNHVSWFKLAGEILGNKEERKKFPGFAPDPDGIQMLAMYLSKKAVEKDVMETLDGYLRKQKGAADKESEDGGTSI